MKRWLGLGLLVFIGTAGWRIGDALSPDALSMAVGVLFGVMAGVPAALLVMAGSRRAVREERGDEGRTRQQGQVAPYTAGWPVPYAQQPPVIVVAGPQGMAGQAPAASMRPEWFSPEAPARHFTVVGEREQLVEEW